MKTNLREQLTKCVLLDQRFILRQSSPLRRTGQLCSEKG